MGHDDRRGTAREPLGAPLRLVQAYYVLVLVVGLVYAALQNPEGDLSFVYDLSMVRAVVQMATSAQAVWLLQRRAAGAREFCVTSTSLCVLLSAVDVFALGGTTGSFALMGAYGTFALVVVEYLLAGAVVAYLTRSRRAGELLSEPLDDSPEGPGHSWDTPMRERVRTWPFWRDLAIYFIVFSFLGHWAEMLFCRLIVAGVFMGEYDPANAMLWDQWLYPFSAEGVALALVVLLLHPLKEWLLRRFGGRVAPTLALSFLANAAACTTIDFTLGVTANADYHLWDYRAMPFNFMGQICLQNSLVYSIAATLVVWVAYPLMDTGLRRMPRNRTDALFFGLAGLYAFEAALHFIVP